MKARLKNVSNAHITTGSWSDHRARGFGSLTVHYIDEEFEWRMETVPATVDHIKVNECSSLSDVTVRGFKSNACIEPAFEPTGELGPPV